MKTWIILVSLFGSFFAAGHNAFGQPISDDSGTAAVRKENGSAQVSYLTRVATGHNSGNENGAIKIDPAPSTYGNAAGFSTGCQLAFGGRSLNCRMAL